MKVAASVISVLGWGSYLAALWIVMMADLQPPTIRFIGVLVSSVFVGMFAPSYLLGLESRRDAESPGERGR